MFVTSCPRSFAIHKCPKNTDKMAVTIVAIMRIDVYVVVMPRASVFRQTPLADAAHPDGQTGRNSFTSCLRRPPGSWPDHCVISQGHNRGSERYPKSQLPLRPSDQLNAQC